MNKSAPSEKNAEPSRKTFLQMVRSSFRLKLFFLKSLPMAFLAGLRIPQAGKEEASVSVSMGYLTKNPFRSIYFACLSMAAELSTGVLAMNAIEQSGAKFSVLVTGLKAEFTKKAVGQITFKSCDGEAMITTVQKCLKNKDAGTCTAISIGTNETGETVAEFNITWSFKPK
jgi:hypothetical protein